jgi:type IV fimbrial biogenesis protein FimT
MCKKTIRLVNYRTNRIVRLYKNSSFELGFSLIELLFTIALSSILLMLTFPVYRDLILKLRLFILTERVSSTLYYARSEAIRHQSVITICKSKNAKTCSGNWKDGWIVLLKKPTTSLENGKLLRVYPSLSHIDFLEWHGFHSDDYLQVYPDGSNGQNGSFIICVQVLSKKKAWLVKVSQTGRIRIDKKNKQKMDCNN